MKTVPQGRTRPVVIVGAGLVGTLLAIVLARRGCRVDVYERLRDPRTLDRSSGRSINLTLCTRGFAALDRAGIGDAVRAFVAPVRGRALHLPNMPVRCLPYGPHNESLFAIARNELGTVLLAQAQQVPGIQFHFGYCCSGLNLDKLRVELTDTTTGQRISRDDAFIIGADGAFSTVRLSLQQQYHFNYSQEYSSSSYIELPIIPARDNGWSSLTDLLHLWPRGHSMLLAIPNRDGTFTGTLILPSRGPGSFETLNNESSVLALMRLHFPDAVDHIPRLENTYFSARPIPMVTVRCNPWSHRGRALLIGDAAHAIFPSYGQGANAGFEDCSVLEECFEVCGGDWEKICALFEERRRSDTDIIAALSKQHLIDLQDTMSGADFTLRSRIETRLTELLPGTYRSLYGMVAFTCRPYSEALQSEARYHGLIDDLVSMPQVQEAPDSLEATRIMKAVARRHGLLALEDV